MFSGVNQEVVLSVFESWTNRIKGVIKCERRYYTKQRKTGDTSSRMAEKTGGHKLMDPLYPDLTRHECQRDIMSRTESNI
jgi:hypothetical protein